MRWGTKIEGKSGEEKGKKRIRNRREGEEDKGKQRKED